MIVGQSIELAEYQKRYADVRPDPADLRLAERLSAQGDLAARLDVRWLRGGRAEITSSSWVGVASFSGLEIRVVPKLAGGTLRVLQMIEYANSVRLLTHLPRDRQLPAGGEHLFELIVFAFLNEVRKLIREGLIRDYRPRDDTLKVMRGRLRMRDQFLRRYGSMHQLECHFDEYDGDVPENQLLAAALTAAGAHVQPDELRAGSRALAWQLADVCQPPTRDPGWYRQRIRYGRRNQRYRPAHELAQLILDGLALRDLDGGNQQRVSAFLLNMNSIFERFVTRLVEDSLSGTPLAVSAQPSFGAAVVDDVTGQSYVAIRPDLIITDAQTGQTVPIDIKYKLYDTKKLDTADIYQLFTYAYALGGGAKPHRAGLVYASMANTTGPALRIRPAAGMTGARIYGAGLAVPRILDALTADGPESVHAEVRSIVQQITGVGCNVP